MSTTIQSQFAPLETSNYPSVRSQLSKPKPFLPPPQTGAFALHYLMTKMGINSDSSAAFAYKQEMELLDADTQEVYQKRLEELAKTLEQERTAKRWSVATKMTSWMTAFSGLATGVVMIATGVGAVAGALLIAGGLVQLGNQSMEELNGWQKVAEKLPGDTEEIRLARLTLIQMGVAAVSVIIAAAGVFTGGFSQAKNAYTTASKFTASALASGQGVIAIGSGIHQGRHQEKLGALAKFDIQLTVMKQIRRDLLTKFEGSVDHLEKLFQGLNRSLDFERELFQADQMIYRG